MLQQQGCMPYAAAHGAPKLCDGMRKKMPACQMRSAGHKARQRPHQRPGHERASHQRESR